MAREHRPLRGAINMVSGVVYATSTVAAVLLVWLLARQMGRGDADGAIALGLGLVGLLAMVMAWYVAAGVLNVIIDNEEELGRLHRSSRSASEQQAQMLADVIGRLDGLAHWTAMSEATRSLLVRKREIEVFVKHIELAINEGDWPEADRLIAMFQDHFGDATLAGQLRGQLESARGAADDRDIRSRIGEIRKLMDEPNFPAAELALTRLGQQYPNDRRLDDLRSTFVRAQKRYQSATREQFARLLEEGKFEQAAPLIDEMTWLEPAELNACRDQWKDRVRVLQQDARAAFTAAVKEKQWSKAIEHGEEILRRFAETALANDVGKLIDRLREKAASESVAAIEVDTTE
jgi:hypothetical protein